MATAEEMFKDSQAGTTEASEVIYLVRGTDARATAITTVKSTAATAIGTQRRQDKGIRAEPIAWETWLVRVPYSKRPLDGGGSPDVGEFVLDFDTSGGALHVAQSLETTQAYAITGRTAGTSDFGGLIGVNEDGSVEGVDIPFSMDFEFTVRTTLEPDDVDPTYIGNLYTLSRRTNNASFSVVVDGQTMSFAAYECVFFGAVGSWRADQNLELVLKFGATPNVTGLSIAGGTITGIAKNGSEYLWTYRDSRDLSSTLKVRAPRVLSAYVEKVVPDGNFALLTP